MQREPEKCPICTCYMNHQTTEDLHTGEVTRTFVCSNDLRCDYFRVIPNNPHSDYE